MMKRLLLRFFIPCLFIIPLFSCTKPNAGESDSQSQEEPERPLKIAFITDTHYGQTLTTNSDTERIIEDINTLDGVDFVLMGGDLTNHGTDAQIQKAKTVLDKLKVPCWVVSGNHDSKWSESGCTTFIKTIGYEHFEFEAGGYRFLGCSSGPDIRSGLAMVSNEHLVWLKSLEKGKPVIFLNHYPLGDGMANWFDVRRELLRLDCRIVVGGHVHSNKKYDYKGLPGFTGRTSLRGEGYPAYNIITIEDGTISVAERRLTDEGPIMLAPWYQAKLTAVSETLSYDSDGLPQNYKWMKYSENTGYPQVNVVWSKVEGANIGAGFAIDGSTSWYVTTSGKIVALSVTDGSVRWSKEVAGKIWSTPAYSEGIVVFTCTNGSVYALDAKTGSEKWEYAGNSKVASPLIHGNTVYVGSNDGYFRAFNLTDGKLLWKCGGISGFCDLAPFVDDNQVVLGSWGGNLYSINASTGKLQWTWDKSPSFYYSPGGCSPVKSGNKLFLASPARYTYCVDSKNGTTLFSVPGARESLTISNDLQTVYVKVTEGKAQALNVSDGSIVWEVETGLGEDLATSALCVAGEDLLIPSATGSIIALDRTTGSLRWRHKIGIGLVNPLTAWEYNGKTCILASSMDGRIELLEVSE